MVPAGKKLGTENFEQLLKIAQRYKLGSQAEKMLADRGRDLRKRVKPILQSITRVRREAFKFHEEAERSTSRNSPWPRMRPWRKKTPLSPPASWPAPWPVPWPQRGERREAAGRGAKGREAEGREAEGRGGVRKPQRVSKPSAKVRENLADKAVEEEREGKRGERKERGEGEDQESHGEKIEDLGL